MSTATNGAATEAAPMAFSLAHRLIAIVSESAAHHMTAARDLFHQ